MSLPTSVAELQEAHRGGQTFDLLCFWGHRPGPHGVDKSCFSQWWPARFTVDGVPYPTAEHWMMAEKARLFDDDDALARILASEDPGRAKALGRKVRGFDQDAWVAARRAIVVRGNLAKFDQNPAERAFLLGTGHQVLVEASPVDAIWGIGLAATDPGARDPLRWRGQNLLGFALMQVREQLRAS